MIHPAFDRLLSAREIARAQGFPDMLQLSGTASNKYRQAGNAVPCPMARALGFEIARVIAPSEEEALTFGWG